MREPDALTRFLIEGTDVRGHIVHMDDSWRDARNRGDYPDVIAQVLGEAFAAAVLLAATIKFDGKMTFQIRGTGAVHLLVIQVTAEHQVRGLAKWSNIPSDSSLSSMFGADARLMITIEADRDAEPYQGIVELVGDNLSQALQHYFVNSEQLDTELILSVQGDRASGLLLQKLPGVSVDNDGWNRTVQLAKTLTSEELIALDAKTLVHRLYHQETVRLFDSDAIVFLCSCSRERTDGLILSLGRNEADSILEEQGQIEVVCEFCNADYQYDSIDVAALFSTGTMETDSDKDTLH